MSPNSSTSEAERSSPPTAGGSKKQEDAESGKQEIQLRREEEGVLTLMGGLGRGDGGGNPRVLAAESNTSSLEMPESSRRDFSHDEMDKKVRCESKY